MANPRTSNSRLLAIGFAVLVVGVVLVLLIIRNTDDPPAQPSPVATESQAEGDGGGEDQDTAGGDGQPQTPEEFAAGRLPMPLPVPDGFEALAVRMNYVRSVAAIPSPGDRVNVYRFLGADDEDAPAQPAQPQQPAEGEETEGETEIAQPVVTPPSTGTAGPPAELVLEDMEVLGIVGPLPSANDGTLTVLLATPPEVVPALMPLADAAQLWFTLLPDAPDDAATDEPSAPATEES